MWQSQREQLWMATQEMVRDGLVSGHSGNVSIRLSGGPEGGLVMITPSGQPYSELRVEEMAVMDLEGEPVEEVAMPSSEAHLHLAIYKARRDVAAVAHTHSVFASVAAVAGLAIPPILDEMVVTLGGQVALADYGFPGTEELSHRALEGLADRKAVLLRNHGMVGVGASLPEALEVCRLVERAAQIFVHASILGRANPLPPEIVEVQRSIYRMQQRARLASGREVSPEEPPHPSPRSGLK